MIKLRVLALPVLAALGLSVSSYAAPRVQTQPSGTLLDQGLWWLYHLQYDQARRLFDQHIASNPKDPSGYFYKTATDWWELAQQFDRALPDAQAQLEKDFQATVDVAETLLKTASDDKTRALACLYSGGAQGLKGRWLVTQGQWLKAYFMGKNGHRMLKKALKYNPELYDAYLGLGIYDYYTDTLSGAQKVLAALLIRGSRTRGLKELQVAIEKGEHARVEAMMFLIEIYTWEEDTPEKSLKMAQQLRDEFPKSPAMYLTEIIQYYELKQWDMVTQKAADFMEKSDREVPYFQQDGVFPARYCLGVAALWGKRDPDTCLHYMNLIIDQDYKTSRWVTFAHLRIGQVYDLKGEREKALANYQIVLSRPNFWGSHHEARLYTQQPFKY